MHAQLTRCFSAVAELLVVGSRHRLMHNLSNRAVSATNSHNRAWHALDALGCLNRPACSSCQCMVHGFDVSLSQKGAGVRSQQTSRGVYSMDRWKQDASWKKLGGGVKKQPTGTAFVLEL